MSKNLHGLYAITDEVLTPKSSVVAQVEKALRAGVDIVQFRDKSSLDSEVESICVELQELCTKHNATFIIDDRVELVAKIGADGLHIGKDDIPLNRAREIVGKNVIIGVSCYGEIKRAEDAQKGLADYVAFGSFFHSSTKPKSTVVDALILKEAKEILNIPICAIGGINSSNIDELLMHKPDMISVVSAIFGDKNIEERVKELKSKIFG